MSEKAKRRRKMTPYTQRWERLAGDVARGYVNTIYPCTHCGYPVVKGYRCGGCDSTDPEGASRR